jgi:hypothetical protein
MGLLQPLRERMRQVYRGRGIFYFLYRSIGEPPYPLLCLHAVYWQLRAALTGERLVHMVGDSHTSAYNFGRGVVVHHVGQATAHNLWAEKSSTDSRKIFLRVLRGIARQDVVGLVFGEIDCRIHFFYQHKKTGKPYGKLMDATIANYGKAMDCLKSGGMRFFVVGVPPVGTQGNVYGWPAYGSRQERARISREFNLRLGKYCHKRGVPFFDPQEFAADGRGCMKSEFLRDDIHLNAKALPYMLAFAEKEFGKPSAAKVAAIYGQISP